MIHREIVRPTLDEVLRFAPPLGSGLPLISPMKWPSGGPAAPTVTSIDPRIGPTSTAVAAITIVGVNFTGATGVTIGGAACTSVVVVDDNTITCVGPNSLSVAGDYNVVVTGPGGNGTLTNGFSVIAGMKLWLRSDVGITSAGAPPFVSAWADQSGLGNDFSQATGFKQPPLNTADANLNGRRSIGPFDEANLQSLAWAGSVDVAAPYSIFLVTYNVTNGTAKYPWGTGGANQSDLYINGTLHFISGSVDIQAAAGSGFSGKYIAGGDSPVTTGTVAIYHNAITAAATAGVGTAPPDLFDVPRRIGRYAESPANFAWPGTIAEIVAIAPIATTGERTRIFNHFAARYAITVGP